jgi:hypothetical protein
MKIYVKTSTNELSSYNPDGKLVEYSIITYDGPFECVREAANWALDAGHEGFEILEFEE